MKRLLLLLLFTFSFVIGAFACRCEVNGSPETFIEERYESSDFVVSAKVEFVRDSLTKGSYIMSPDQTYWRKGGYNPVLRVNKVYKGEIKADTIELTPDWSNCSQYFKTGDTYIIFGRLNKRGEYTTSMCSGNFSMTKDGMLKVFQRIAKE